MSFLVILFSLLVNAPAKTKAIICAMSEEQAGDLLKKLFNKFADKFAPILGQTAAVGKAFGVDVEKALMRIFAENEDLCRRLPADAVSFEGKLGKDEEE